MSIIKSFSVGNGDMFYIRHNADSFSIIDCCMDEHSREGILRELKEGVKRGYEEGKEIQNLIDSGTVAVTGLGDTGKSIYASLVAGDTVQTLDDGEASVIACAVEIKGVAVIDERKAKRVCRERFPQTSTMMTIDLLLDEAVEDSPSRVFVCGFGSSKLYPTRHFRVSVVPVFQETHTVARDGLLRIKNIA